MRVGVLALQGDFAAHAKMLQKLEVETCEVRLPEQLQSIDALIIPGGESTTLIKLMTRFEMINELIQFHEKRKPIFGTCAGAILLAAKLSNTDQKTLNFINIEIERNAYGRQIDSFEAQTVNHAFGREPVPMIFIRAPVIRKCHQGVEKILFWNEQVVLARQNHILVATFHPELTSDTRIHRYFLSLVAAHV